MPRASVKQTCYDTKRLQTCKVDGKEFRPKLIEKCSHAQRIQQPRHAKLGVTYMESKEGSVLISLKYPVPLCIPLTSLRGLQLLKDSVEWWNYALADSRSPVYEEYCHTNIPVYLRTAQTYQQYSTTKKHEPMLKKRGEALSCVVTIDKTKKYQKIKAQKQKGKHKKNHNKTIESRLSRSIPSIRPCSVVMTKLNIEAISEILYGRKLGDEQYENDRSLESTSAMIVTGNVLSNRFRKDINYKTLEALQPSKIGSVAENSIANSDKARSQQLLQNHVNLDSDKSQSKIEPVEIANRSTQSIIISSELLSDLQNTSQNEALTGIQREVSVRSITGMQREVSVGSIGSAIQVINVSSDSESSDEETKQRKSSISCKRKKSSKADCCPSNKLLKLSDSSSLNSFKFCCTVCNSHIECVETMASVVVRDHYYTKHAITNIDVKQTKLPDGSIRLLLVEVKYRTKSSGSINKFKISSKDLHNDSKFDFKRINTAETVMLTEQTTRQIVAANSNSIISSEIDTSTSVTQTTSNNASATSREVGVASIAAPTQEQTHIAESVHAHRCSRAVTFYTQSLNPIRIANNFNDLSVGSACSTRDTDRSATSEPCLAVGLMEHPTVHPAVAVDQHHLLKRTTTMNTSPSFTSSVITIKNVSHPSKCLNKDELRFNDKVSNIYVTQSATPLFMNNLELIENSQPPDSVVGKKRSHNKNIKSVDSCSRSTHVNYLRMNNVRKKRTSSTGSTVSNSSEDIERASSYYQIASSLLGQNSSGKLKPVVVLDDVHNSNNILVKDLNQRYVDWVKLSETTSSRQTTIEKSIVCDSSNDLTLVKLKDDKLLRGRQLNKDWRPTQASVGEAGYYIIPDESVSSKHDIYTSSDQLVEVTGRLRDRQTNGERGDIRTVVRKYEIQTVNNGKSSITSDSLQHLVQQRKKCFSNTDRSHPMSSHIICLD